MLNEIQSILDKVPHPVTCFRRMGAVLTLDSGAALTGAGQLPRYSAKFFSSGCHVTLFSAGEHRIGSQMTEVRGQRDRTTVSERLNRRLPARFTVSKAAHTRRVDQSRSIEIPPAHQLRLHDNLWFLFEPSKRRALS